MNTRGKMIGTEPDGASSIKNFYGQACMSEMTSGALFFRTDHINAPFKEYIKPSLQLILVVNPVALNESLELSKNSSIGFRFGEYGGK